jgi:hypothetical protein
MSNFGIFATILGALFLIGIVRAKVVAALDASVSNPDTSSQSA